MPRYKLTVEYDGSSLVGWQKQDNGVSVQSLLEQTAAKLFGCEVAITGAGRTDAGVHATGQVAHFDVDREMRPDNVRDALNYWLFVQPSPPPVVVLAAERVEDDFHARFSAIGRRYLYRIVNRRAPLTLDRGRAWQVPKRLDADLMHHCAQILVGHHDFSSFRAVACQAKSPCKTLDRLDVRREGDDIFVEAAARSFLHHQVRNMVGSLKWVGEGHWS